MFFIVAIFIKYALKSRNIRLRENIVFSYTRTFDLIIILTHIPITL